MDADMPERIPMPGMNKNTPPDEARRRARTIGFLNWGHLLDHYVLLIYPTVILGLQAFDGRQYGDLLKLSWMGFTAFGLLALPCGWLADHWSRRNMMAIYFFGTGVATAAVGLASSFTALAIALCAVGVFAAIYHPVGLPTLVDTAVNRARTMSWNGVFGNVGVSIASGITALIVVALGWRAAFFVPAAVFIVTGILYVWFVPDEGRRQTPRPTAHDVVLDRRLTITVVSLFMLLALFSGLVFNCLTITLPKIVDARIGGGVPIALVGSIATAVFLCGALAQISMGRLVERIAPHVVMSGIAIAQLVAMLLVTHLTGWSLLPALALAVAAVYAQVTVGDFILARYTPSAWRGRVYALRFFLIFTVAGPTVWAIGRLWDRGGADLVLFVTAIIAALFAINSLAITFLVAGAEGRRTRAAVVAPAE
jgi:MFS family permease